MLGALGAAPALHGSVSEHGKSSGPSSGALGSSLSVRLLLAKGRVTIESFWAMMDTLEGNR